MLCIVPSLVSLRLAFPKAHITLIGLESSRTVMQRFHGLCNDHLMFPGFPGIPECAASPEKLAEFLAQSRQHEFDLAVQMHGSGRVMNAFVAMLGAGATAGFYPAMQAKPAGAYLPYPDSGPEALRWLSLARALGGPAVNGQAAWPVAATDVAAIAGHPSLGRRMRRPFVCLHAGARDPARRWPAERFAAVGDALARHGFEVILTGTASERGVGAAVEDAMKYPVTNVIGETSIAAAAALLQRARLLVTNDTGVSHLAAAVATPSVVIFLESEPDRWAPVDRARHRCVVSARLAMLATSQMRVSRENLPSVAEVLEEAFAALAISPPPPLQSELEAGAWPAHAYGG